MQVTVSDTTAAGREIARLLLDDVPSSILLRDLITHRVREEVARSWAHEPGTVDWQEQAEAALAAFRRNGYFVVVGDRQIEDLDEELTLAEADVVTFIRLVPLAGG
jgi:hypothetical protein